MRNGLRQEASVVPSKLAAHATNASGHHCDIVTGEK
jgi:hypothetical protein